MTECDRFHRCRQTIYPNQCVHLCIGISMSAPEQAQTFSNRLSQISDQKYLQITPQAYPFLGSDVQDPP